MGRDQFLNCIKNNGIVSFCTADLYAIHTVLQEIEQRNGYAVIEVTSNQVNPEGGYTGMNAMDFRNLLASMARHVGLEENKLILGGDHLGPLPWANLPPTQAMEKAEILIRESVRAGFQKLHIDTTMPLGDEISPPDEEVITDRWIRLYQIAEEEASLMAEQDPDYEKPVYVIGNEVPVAGGNPVGREEILQITNPESLKKTLCLYREKFCKIGIPDAFENIIAIVGDFGIGYSNREICEYPRGKARKLTEVLQAYPRLVLEAHSTDFQSPESLQAMKKDGIRIFKVGPELSYAHREALLALTRAERKFLPRECWANFPEMLEQAMENNPTYWENWYHGTEAEQRNMRMHSRLNRDRYYMNLPEVKSAEEKLLNNLGGEEVLPFVFNGIGEVAEKYLEVLE